MGGPPPPPRPMPEPRSDQQDLDEARRYAARALNCSPAATEEDIRVKVRDLLRSIAKEESTLLLEHRIQSINRPCDIYLPEYRFIAEVKSVKSGEAVHPKQASVEQLTDYVEALLDDELGRLPLTDPKYDPHREWVGLVTDGRNWHFYEWKHARTSKKQLKRRLCGADEEELVVFLTDILKRNRPAGKTWIPDRPNAIYDQHQLMRDLEKLSEKISPRHQKKRQTCFQLWRRALEASGLVPSEGGQDKLFVQHCYLVLIARCVVATTKKRADLTIDGPALADDGFTAWLCDSSAGCRWLQKLADVTHEYEWSGGRGHDVLRALYEDIIDKENRKLFGEYYTPDWLAHWLCKEVMDDRWLERSVATWLEADAGGHAFKGCGVLDPTCGSGTFLIAAAQRIRGSYAVKKRGLSPDKVGRLIAALVHGIDIHPVAVELATANLSRALPEAASQGLPLKVYLGDALRMESFDAREQGEIFKSTFLSTRGTGVSLPAAFLEKKDFPQRMRDLVDAANPGKPAQLRQRPDIVRGLSEEDKQELEKAAEDLRTIIEDEGNSIWAWYAEQAVGPDLIEKNKVDRIVANPPWVTMKVIQSAERKRALERMAGKPKMVKSRLVAPPGSLGIWPGGRLAPLWDIAAMFLHRCSELYLSGRWRAGWLTNAAALRGKTWELLREKRNTHWHMTVDFGELREPPFHGAKSCAIIETYQKNRTTKVQTVSSNVKVDRAGRPDAEIKKLDFADKKPLPPGCPSDYQGQAHMGASLLPHVLVFVEQGSEQVVTKKGVTRLRTKRSKRSPWRDVEALELTVPTHWLLPVLQGRDVCPFYFPPREYLDTAIIPLNDHGGLLESMEASEHGCYSTANNVYREHRGSGKGTPETLLSQINYLSKLSRQLPVTAADDAGRFVCYKQAGAVMGAARQAAGTVINDTLYRVETSSEREALYLVSILNAPALRDAYLEYRTSDRHFHTRPWEKIPIARFDPEKKNHVRLAELGRQAEILALQASHVIMGGGGKM